MYEKIEKKKKIETWARWYFGVKGCPFSYTDLSFHLENSLGIGDGFD